MSRQVDKSEVVDTILKILATGGVVSAGLFAPNSLQAFDKPLRLYFKKLDDRKRQREIRRTLTYMRSKNLVKGTYEHGLQITDKGRSRLESVNFKDLEIKVPSKWDKKWRVVFFDIPEEKKTGRDGLTRKIKELGFKQLQKSVWIFPYECRQEIEIITARYDVDRFVTYIETSFIDKQKKLQQRFNLK